MGQIPARILNLSREDGHFDRRRSAILDREERQRTVAENLRVVTRYVLYK
jgi:hypothetical protein